MTTELGSEYSKLKSTADAAVDLFISALGYENLPLIGPMRPKSQTISQNILEVINKTIDDYLSSSSIDTPNDLPSAINTNFATPEGTTDRASTEVPIARRMDWDENTGNFLIEVRGRTPIGEVPLASNLGVSGVSFNVSGVATADLSYDFLLKGGINSAGNFFINVADSYFNANTKASLRSAVISGTLGPLHIVARDQPVDALSNPSLNGQKTSVDVNIKVTAQEKPGPLDFSTINDILFGGQEILDYINVAVDGTALLSLGINAGADASNLNATSSGIGFIPNFSFDFSTPLDVSYVPTRPNDGFQSGAIANVGKLYLDNIQVDLGSYLNDTVAPAIAAASKILAPVFPVVDFFTRPIARIDEGTTINWSDVWENPGQALGGALVNQAAKNALANFLKIFDVDQSAAVTPIEIIKKSGLLYSDILANFDQIYESAKLLPNWATTGKIFDDLKNSIDAQKSIALIFNSTVSAAEKALSAIDSIKTLSEAINVAKQQAFDKIYQLGNYQISLGATDQSAPELNKVNLPVSVAQVSDNSGGPSVSGQVAADGRPPETGLQAVDNLIQKMYSMGFQMPILTDAGIVAKTILSQAVDILTYETQFIFNPKDEITLPINLFDIINLVLPGFSAVISQLPAKLQLDLSAAFNLQANIAFGVDTQGLLDWSSSGDSQKVIEGFYFLTRQDGRNIPEFSTDFNIGSKVLAQVGAEMLGADVSINAGLRGNINLELLDPSGLDGKVRLSEIENNIDTPSKLFSASGSADIYASATAAAWLDIPSIVNLPAEMTNWIAAIPGGTLALQAVNTAANFLPNWKGEITAPWSANIFNFSASPLGSSYSLLSDKAISSAYAKGKFSDDLHGVVVADLSNATSYFRIFGSNDVGKEYGSYLGTSGTFHGAIIGNDKKVTPVDYLGVKSNDTVIYNSNDHGEFIGYYRSGSSDWNNFLWNGDEFQTVNPIGSVQTYLWNINNNEQIVGEYLDSGGKAHQFLYENGKVKEIPPPKEAIEVFAHGLNDNGQVVGCYSDSNYKVHGFIYGDGEYTTLDVPSSSDTYAVSINDAGAVVGEYIDEFGHMKVFIYNHGGYATIEVPQSKSVAVSQITNSGAIMLSTFDGSTPKDLTFSDYTFHSLQPISKSADDIYLLYGAILGRTPDAAGFDYWIDESLKEKLSISKIGESFLNSSEYLATGAQHMSEGQYVTYLYETVLNRAPDPQGFDYWNAFSSAGHSRVELVLAFVQSSEVISVSGVRDADGYNIIL